MPTPSNDLNISQPGYIVFDGVATFFGRTFQAGSGIVLSNASGISGNTTISTNGATVGNTITGNTGGPLSPTAGNWNILGNNTGNNGFASFTTGSGSTLTVNSYGLVKWVVHPVAGVGTHTTIQAALNTAASGDTIGITAGTYTENPVLKAGVDLVAFDADALTPNVIINGKLTATFAGTMSISGICLQTNSDYCLEVTGNSATVIYLKNCFISALNNSAIHHTSSSSSSKIDFRDCRGDTGALGVTYFVSTSAGAIKFIGGALENSFASTTASTYSGAGGISFYNAYFACAITTSGSGGFTAICVQFTSPLIIGATGNNNIFNTYLTGGSSSAAAINNLATLVIVNSTIDSTNINAISKVAGTATLQYSNLSFVNTSSLIDATLTQVPLVASNDAVKIKTPSAYPYTTIPQDAVILVDTSVARTIIPLASPTTGQKFIIKDSVGTAATFNITVTPSGKNIDGQASYVINTNYGSMTIIYNGTEWSVV